MKNGRFQGVQTEIDAVNADGFQFFADLGIHKVKITGGEPFVRKNICHLIRRIKQIPGIDSVTLTTNGTLALQHLEELKAIG